MEGTLVLIGHDKNENPDYGVIFHSSFFSVSLREIGIRPLRPGDKVTFMTDRETGAAILGDPPPIRGCEVR